MFQRMVRGQFTFPHAHRYEASETSVLKGTLKYDNTTFIAVMCHVTSLLSMLLAARFLPFITSRCEAVLVAPVRGSEHFPRERVERLSRSMSMCWSASGYSKLLNPRLESRFLAKRNVHKTSRLVSSSDHENMLSSAEPLKPKSRSSKEVELLSPSAMP